MSRNSLTRLDTKTCIILKAGNYRSYKEGEKFDWHVPVQDLFIHVMDCQTECPQLNMALDNLFRMLPNYQKQAA